MVPRNRVRLNKMDMPEIICPVAIKMMYPFFKLKKSHISSIGLTSLYNTVGLFKAKFSTG
jgi:hypothetical protein